MLDKVQLKSSIKQAFIDQQEKTDNPSVALDDLAGKIADAVDDYVKGATIVATPANVATAAFSNGAGPVVAANNLTSTIS